VGRNGIFNIVKAIFNENILEGFKDNFFIDSELLVGVLGCKTYVIKVTKKKIKCQTCIRCEVVRQIQIMIIKMILNICE
jgi:hypothetical protein